MLTVAELTELAERGDAVLQCYSGVKHMGQGPVQDFAEAAKWYRLAAQLPSD